MLSSVLLFLDMSGGEMVVIMLVALLVLGPQKLGTAARKAGKMINEVKRVSSDFTEQLKQETSGITEEVQGIRETIRDTASELKDQMLKDQEEAEKKKTESETEVPVKPISEEPITTTDQANKTEESVTDTPSSDIYNISASETPPPPPPYMGYNNECHPYELELKRINEEKQKQAEIDQATSEEVDLNQNTPTQTKDNHKEDVVS